MESILADNPFVNPLGPSSLRRVRNICRTNVDFPPPTFKVKDFSYIGKVLILVINGSCQHHGYRLMYAYEKFGKQLHDKQTFRLRHKAQHGGRRKNIQYFFHFQRLFKNLTNLQPWTFQGLCISWITYRAQRKL